MASQEKITVYNLADLKNTSDDAIPNYLNSLHFTQSHRLTDVRLTLGFSAFLLAAATFLWDHQLGFDSTKYLTAAAVAVYTLLNTALTVWILYVERGTVYVGKAPSSGEEIRISTGTKKNVPVYEVTVEITSPKGEKRTIEIKRSFTEWFDGTGRFVAAPFQSMLAGSVDVIGKADPKRAAEAKKEEGGEAAVYTPEMLDALAKANVSVVGSAAEEATGLEQAGKKGGKRRKA